MTKIMKSLSVIAFVAALVTVGTGAYFGDTETSTDNVFTAGAIDLTVGNTCYYNGMACTDNGSTSYWNGDVSQGECACTWDLDDLTGKLFFNFDDIKPGDHGEDTISLHVTSNDAWACGKIEMTENDDVTCVDPEVEAEGPDKCNEVADDLFDGELAQNLEFIFWADDGDNVLEGGELVAIGETVGLAVAGIGVDGSKFTDILNDTTDKSADEKNRNLTIADNVWSMFEGTPGEPLTGGATYHIGKAWCFGELTITPKPAGSAYSPTTADNIVCNGVSVDNASQTDRVKGNLSFSVVQHRNNTEFLCPEHVGQEIGPL